MRLEYKIDLLTSKLAYMRKDKNYCAEVLHEAKAEFYADFMQHISDLSEREKKLIYDFINKSAAIPDKNQTKGLETRKKETPDSIKKVFKEIAKKTHPDITDDDDDTIFKRAQRAVDEESYSDLLEIAKDLNISPPEPTEKDVKLLEEEVVSINKKMKEMKETYAWVWYHTCDRDAIMERYIVRISKMCAGT